MIKLVFISNILDQSMIGFCDEMYKQNSISFSFVTYRSKMSSVKTRSNIERVYRFDYNDKIEKEIIDKADALIIGHAPDYFIQKYRKTKLIFKSSERLFKENATGLKKIKRKLSIIKHHARFQCENLRYLAIGNGAITDIKKTKLYKNKAYEWVYFPEIDYSFGPSDIEKKDRDLNKLTKIVWAGRMVECKNVDVIINSVKKAIQCGHKIELLLVGDGPLKPYLMNLSTDCPHIKFLGLKPLNETLHIIKQSDFLFMASDKREGWGMVVNNAINYGTNVIGNALCGSVSTILNDRTAFLYNKNDEAYTTLIRAITSDPSVRKEMAAEAYNDLITKWSPKVGANRFAEKLQSIIIDKNEIFYKDGLFS